MRLVPNTDFKTAEHTLLDVPVPEKMWARLIEHVEKERPIILERAGGRDDGLVIILFTLLLYCMQNHKCLVKPSGGTQIR